MSKGGGGQPDHKIPIFFIYLFIYHLLNKKINAKYTKFQNKAGAGGSTPVWKNSKKNHPVWWVEAFPM